MGELKSCPFCGGKEKHEAGCLFQYVSGFNNESMCIKVSGITWEEFAFLWNTRTIDGNTYDGYHTFNELYHHRAVLFSKLVQSFKEKAWKSKKHSDGTMFDGMFIVGIETPYGQATYHYDIDPYWDMFDCKENEYAPVWDGHTAQEAIDRIAAWDTSEKRACKGCIYLMNSYYDFDPICDYCRRNRPDLFEEVSE